MHLLRNLQTIYIRYLFILFNRQICAVSRKIAYPSSLFEIKFYYLLFEKNRNLSNLTGHATLKLPIVHFENVFNDTNHFCVREVLFKHFLYSLFSKTGLLAPDGLLHCHHIIRNNFYIRMIKCVNPLAKYFFWLHIILPPRCVKIFILICTIKQVSNCIYIFYFHK